MGMTGVILSDKEVNNILNEQDKEIKLLKEENEQLKSYTGEMEDYLARLEEENEQLKRQNKELEKFRYSVFQKMNELIL